MRRIERVQSDAFSARVFPWNPAAVCRLQGGTWS